MDNSTTTSDTDSGFWIDDIDRQILALLQQNGRMTNAALSEAVGLTATPLQQRVKKLEQRGVITGYAALVDRSAVGRATLAFVHVKLAQHRIDTHRQFLALVDDLPEVLECHHIAGEHDFLLKVAVRDIPEYERFLLHRLSNEMAIDRVKTTFVLSSHKDAKTVPIG